VFLAPLQTLLTFGTAPRGWRRFARTILTGAILSLGATWAQAERLPQVLLFGAALDEARSFAVDTASSRGWNVLSVASSTAVFEQSLDEDEGGEAENRHLLRIYADFAEETSGVRVSLHAEEVDQPVDAPDTAEESMTDVTGRYGDNLSNALASLRSKWDSRRESPGAATSPQRPSAMGRLSASADRPSGQRGGAWAYNAERYAESRGCELTERATQLAASGPDWEQHLVFCRNGSSLRVECRHGDCTSRP